MLLGLLNAVLVSLVILRAADGRVSEPRSLHADLAWIYLTWL